MKKWFVIALGVLLVCAGAAVLWPRSGAGGSADGREGEPRNSLAQTVPEFETVKVESDAPSGLALTGVVKDALGQPVAGATVSLASSAQASLVTVRCSVCDELLLSCQSRQTWSHVRDVLASGKGQLAAGATTRTDADGRFRFDNLVGVSFSVWAQSDAHGLAIHERAAPGDPVELFLPPLRAVGGVVTDESGAPVPHAHVHVVSRRIPVPVEATTDANGVFDARGLGEGPFYVLVDAPGYLPHVERSVEAGPQLVRMKLLRPRVVEVEVRRGGAPVDSNVHVSADHLDLDSAAPGGLARISGLWPDDIWLTASAQNLSAPAQRVTLNDPVTRVRLELEAAGQLAVTVVDESGQPVANPELQLGRARDPEPILRRKVSTGELATLGPIAVGEYVLVGSAEGHRTAELPVRITEGETAVELVLAKGTFIRGRVLDEYGRPAPRISVLVNPTGDNFIADENGNFVVEVPSAGFYELQAHHSDWGGGAVRVTAPADGVELHLEPKAGLRVTVLSSGRRLEGADVVLWVEREATYRNDRPSGSDGVVLMRGMPPATYNLIAHHRDHLPSERQPVVLREGELVEVTVNLEPGLSIKGKVVDQHGAPVSGATVGAIPRGAEPATTDATGQFEIRPVRAGRTYRLDASHPHYDQKERVAASAGGESVTVVMNKRNVFRGRVITDSGEPVRQFRIDEHEVVNAEGRFELPLPAEDGRVFAIVEAQGFQPQMLDQPADQADLGDVVLSREPQVEGVVRDGNGSPIEGAVVNCDVCDAQVTSGADGRFTLSVPPHLGSFVVMASKGALTGTANASPRAQAPIEVVLRRGVRLSGRVYQQSGAPAAGVQVEAVHVDRSEPFSVVTMEDGSYSVEVPEGSYRFTLPGLQRPFGGDPVVFAYVGGEAMTLDLGGAPGSGSLTVRFTPEPGYALWLVRGTVTAVANPPVELFKSAYAQMLYQPRGDTVTLQGIPPGHYTLIWSRFHAQSEGGPQLRAVDIPQTREVSLAP